MNARSLNATSLNAKSLLLVAAFVIGSSTATWAATAPQSRTPQPAHQVHHVTVHHAIHARAQAPATPAPMPPCYDMTPDHTYCYGPIHN